MNKLILHLTMSVALLTIAAGMISSFSCARHMPPNWYVVTGTGVADDSLSSAQQRLMALRAAKEDAWRQLLEAAKGLQINSTTSVRDFMTQDDAIHSRVMGMIRGAQMVGQPLYLEDGSVEVDMRLDMNRIKYLVK